MITHHTPSAVKIKLWFLRVTEINEFSHAVRERCKCQIMREKPGDKRQKKGPNFYSLFYTLRVPWLGMHGITI